MEHIGIDLGSKDSQVRVRNADGTIVGEWRCRTDRLIDFLQDARALRYDPPHGSTDPHATAGDGRALRVQSGANRRQA